VIESPSVAAASGAAGLGLAERSGVVCKEKYALAAAAADVPLAGGGSDVVMFTTGIGADPTVRSKTFEMKTIVEFMLKPKELTVVSIQAGGRGKCIVSLGWSWPWARLLLGTLN
jgi:hypothetical protein